MTQTHAIDIHINNIMEHIKHITLTNTEPGSLEAKLRKLLKDHIRHIASEAISFGWREATKQHAAPSPN